ncbi:MAG: hypothetical protein COU33_00395 [Candidatus Magasanikbacteria bacterium CG10_big_fil_rev_8_21_14_0_10_43_6]|uniref:AtpZ/AtpI family protein n=1 Tax=Candidatus Magasanikbacteria bacterium CG10_big_fil_rev_8_21_14_0_10_43_6 TaxID=1974650 RepID=A0A2M6W2B5_9BACT|nr:MAG: hypothetical protein COU33_00395 [Candidatus Magasanikbacteria bacterium CG10_big_fil_rev_8_21_14_0_10_43_6]
MTQTVEERKEALVHRTFVLMFRILLIFGLPAIAAFFIGRWIDTTYEIRPKGTLAVLGSAFVLSWTLVIRIYTKLSAQFRALQHEEESEKTARQQKIKNDLSDLKE